MAKYNTLIYFSRSVIPSRSANSVHLMKMCQAFGKIYSNVTLFGLRSPDFISKINTFTDYGVSDNFELKLIKTPNRGILIYAYCYFFLYLLFNDRRNKIVYSREPILIYFSCLLGYRSILESHDFFNDSNRRKIERRIFKSKNFLKLVVISQILKNDYQQFFVKTPKIEVHADGADSYTNEDLIKSVWLGRQGVLNIGYFGHLYQGRGIELIIELAKSLGNYDFHIIGGTDSDIVYYKSLELPDNIYFYGFKSQPELPYLRQQCDILLMPYQENLRVFNSELSTARWMSPMKLFEYMSSKRAIVSSNLPVITEVLNDSNSILVPPDNIGAWKNAIIKLADIELRNTIATKAYKDFMLNYTWNIRAKNILTF